MFEVGIVRFSLFLRKEALHKEKVALLLRVSKSIEQMVYYSLEAVWFLWYLLDNVSVDMIVRLAFEEDCKGLSSVDFEKDLSSPEIYIFELFMAGVSLRLSVLSYLKLICVPFLFEKGNLSRTQNNWRHF